MNATSVNTQPFRDRFEIEMLIAATTELITPIRLPNTTRHPAKVCAHAGGIDCDL